MLSSLLLNNQPVIQARHTLPYKLQRQYDDVEPQAEGEHEDEGIEGKGAKSKCRKKETI